MSNRSYNHSRVHARRRRRRATLSELVKMFEAEDAIVNACAATPNPVAASIAVAQAALRLYDEQLPYIPKDAWLYIAYNDERDELRRRAEQEPTCTNFRGLAGEFVCEWSAHLPADELFLSAWKALSYFWARDRWTCS
jgi:hypothetical protein